MNIQDISFFLKEAEQARQRAYAPYSKFRVGAVAIGKNKFGNQIYRIGSNVENASYGLTICAERVAVCSLLQEEIKELEAVVVASEGPEPATPCGACRQFLAEFNKDCDLYLVVGGNLVKETNLSYLLPDGFSLGSK